MTDFMALPGHLYGVGVGPGDPGLFTVKGLALLQSADVVAYHSGAKHTSIARTIVDGFMPDGVIEEELKYPVTTGETSHPGGYYGAMQDFYAESAARLRAHLAAGRSVVVLALGDPLFFGSFMYEHDELVAEFPTEVVPGVTSVSASTAAAGLGLCRHEDTLTVLPGTLPVAELARRLADTEAAVIMKLGRNFERVREALRQAGSLDRAVYVEHASRETQRVQPVAEVDASTVPYMSLILVPGADRRADSLGRAASSGMPDEPRPGGKVFVVGLGPGPDNWLSPEASEVLETVSHVIGYSPYVARIPQREGLARLASGNTVEVDRGRQALELALAGHRVAVVSGGDAGVFGMASAVFEAADDARFADVEIDVIPGITAAHAASALAGAMLGADHALISLSDRLKPWDVVERRLRACARADLAMAFYNPRSSTRPHQLAQAVEILRDELPDEHVVVVARNVGRDGESLHVTTLGAFDPDTVDMSCLVMVGASSTRVTANGRVWTPRFVEG